MSAQVQIDMMQQQMNMLQNTMQQQINMLQNQVGILTQHVKLTMPSMYGPSGPSFYDPNVAHQDSSGCTSNNGPSNGPSGHNVPSGANEYQNMASGPSVAPTVAPTVTTSDHIQMIKASVHQSLGTVSNGYPKKFSFQEILKRAKDFSGPMAPTSAPPSTPTTFTISGLNKAASKPKSEDEKKMTVVFKAKQTKTRLGAAHFIDALCEIGRKESNGSYLVHGGDLPKSIWPVDTHGCVYEGLKDLAKAFGITWCKKTSESGVSGPEIYLDITEFVSNNDEA